MHFKRIRITGFKSFADPVEILVEPGTTGVAGPNGCGKSNIVDAVRWVMGEASSKNMRGGEMEDVIFSGTSFRPAREMAEIVLTIENSDHAAPEPYAAFDEIEVSRKIEREMGSTYRINGREVRARDVHLLFADMSLGAHSGALVGQGRIDQLVLAKPKERRRILEDAAGITGLHRRRHESELKLRGAETNLARLQDLTSEMETRLRVLKRQARAAEKYREFSDEIEKLDYLGLYARYQRRFDDEEKSTRALEEGEEKQKAAEAAHAVASSQETRAIHALKETQGALTEANARLARLDRERALHERDVEKAQTEIVELQNLLEETKADILRQEKSLGVLRARHETLKQEKEALGSEAAASLASLDEGEREKRFGEAEEALRLAQERSMNLMAEKSAASSEEERLSASLEEMTQTKDELLAQSLGEGADALAKEDSLEGVRAKILSMEKTLSEKEAELEEARQKEALTRNGRDEAAKKAMEAAAERDAAKSFLGDHDQSLAISESIMEKTKIKQGYEKAFAAALGDDVMAASDANAAAPSQWTDIGGGGEDAVLPQGAETLLSYVRGPAAMRRRLQQTGLVDAASGDALQKDLDPGQRLVSREGDMWRWDGYRASRHVAEAAEYRLQEWQRLGEIAAASDAAEAAHRQAMQSHEDWVSRTQSLMAEREDAAARMEAARKVEEICVKIAEIQKDQAAAAEKSPSEEATRALEEALESAQKARAQAHGERESAQREKKHYGEKIERLSSEILHIEEQVEEGQNHLAVLSSRHDKAHERHQLLLENPQEMEARGVELEKRVGAAREEQSLKAEALAEGEKERRADGEALRKAAEALSHIREETAGQRAHQENAKTLLGEAKEEAEKKSSMAVEEIPAYASLPEGAPLPDEGALSEQKELLEKKRLGLGAPNLQATEELEELTKRHEEIMTESQDLEGAVRRLRQGIARLNQEARARLLEAFEEAGKHFETLFKRLFGGGKASIAFTEEEDPLEAGLDIVARPPGKKLQSLSLLSGGERTLTALALLFAVFLTRPAPICVLDEVDAPLDERNVERFCALVREMAADKTRFLIVTHHPVTLASMDRLYGVTMQERGVSQLVSVDLGTAEEMSEKRVAAVG